MKCLNYCFLVLQGSTTLSTAQIFFNFMQFLENMAYSYVGAP